MEYYSAVKNNEFIKFSGKSIELENIQSDIFYVHFNHKRTYTLCTHIGPKARNIQDTTHRPHEAHEEGRPKCGYFDPYWKVIEIPMAHSQPID